MKRALYTLLLYLTVSTNAMAIKTDHTRSMEEYFTLGEQARFSATGFLRVSSPEVKPNTCTATVINERTIITAAHCVFAHWNQKAPENIKLITGYFSLTHNGNTDFHATNLVETCLIHPRFDGTTTTFYNDIAQCTLRHPIKDVTPMALFTGDTQSVLTQEAFAIGFGESGDGQKRYTVIKDCRKRGMSVSDLRYDAQHSRLETDFLEETKRVPADSSHAATTPPRGSIAYGDSGGALITIIDDKPYLIGVASSIFFNFKNLPDGPEKNILSSMEHLSANLKGNAALDKFREELLSDLRNYIGYGGTNVWISVSDYVQSFINPFNPFHTVVTHVGGKWSDKIWSNNPNSLVPNNTINDARTLAHYYSVSIYRHTTLDISVEVDRVHVQRNAKLTISPAKSLRTREMIVDHGSLEVGGDLFAEQLTINSSGNVAGSGNIRLYDTNANKGTINNSGRLALFEGIESSIIEGNYNQHQSGVLAIKLNSSERHLIIEGTADLHAQTSLTISLGSDAVLAEGQKWPILTAQKINGTFGRVQIENSDELARKGLTALLKTSASEPYETIEFVLVSTKR